MKHPCTKDRVFTDWFLKFDETVQWLCLKYWKHRRIGRVIQSMTSSLLPSRLEANRILELKKGSGMTKLLLRPFGERQHARHHEPSDAVCWGRFQTWPAPRLRHSAQLPASQSFCFDAATHGTGDQSIRFLHRHHARPGYGALNLFRQFQPS